MGGDEEFLQGSPFGSGGGVGFFPHFSIKLNDFLPVEVSFAPPPPLPPVKLTTKGSLKHWFMVSTMFQARR